MKLSIENIYKVYNDKPILNNVSFYMNDNDKIGIIGVNGEGKSTLLKIIASVEQYEGSPIIKSNGMQISHLNQDPYFNEDDTLYDIISKNSKEEEYAKRSMLNRFGLLNHDKNIKSCSGGEIKRLSLAMTLLTECDVYLLDEPTNHLDNEMIDYLEKFLIKTNKEIIMITHDRYFLDRVVNKIVEVDNGKLYNYNGNYNYYLEEKALRLATLDNEARKRATILKRETEWIRAGVQARSTKSKSRIQRYEELTSSNQVVSSDKIEIKSESKRLGKKIIEIDSIKMEYPSKLLFDNFSYTVLKDDRIGIIGNNGTGKTSLLNIILGNLKATSGIVEIGSTVKIGYFKQKNDFEDENIKVIDYIKEEYNYAKIENEEISANKLLELFLFNKHKQQSLIRLLSGGEKRRLSLLKILLTAPNVLIFDEPTNDLDTITLSVLEDYIMSFNGALICVSHDRYFLDRVCNKIFELSDNKINIYPGNYSDYLEKVETPKKSVKIPDKIKREVTLKMTAKEKNEYNVIDETIEAALNDLKEIESKINETSDFDEINQLCIVRDSLEDKINSLEERWLYLNELNEKILNSRNG